MRDRLLILLAFLAVAVIRITAPSDLYTGDQPYQVSYIRDIVENGAWIVQHHADGSPATKPPLYNWLAAIDVLVAGTTNDFTLKLPSLIAGLITLLLTWDFGKRVTTRRAALYACLLLICSTMFSKQIYFARTDMLLTATIVAQIWAAVRFEEDPRDRWLHLFRLGGALGFLTKGPIALLIPLIVLGTWWWWNGTLRERMRQMRIGRGIVIALIPFAIWFGAALLQEGRAVWNQLVVAETVDRFSAGSSKAKEHRHVLYYIPHLLVRMAPASLFAAIPLARLRGSKEKWVLAALWVLATLVFLSIIPSKRADRLFPLFPALCILAGYALDQFSRAAAVVSVVVGSGFAIAGALAASGLWWKDVSRAPLLVSGALLILLGIILIGGTLRQNSNIVIAGVSLSMLVVIGLYQHWLSDPAMTESAHAKIRRPSSRADHAADPR
jgi:4-amino-4-deoxy-L-arabinose transferase-like glycosyltransferase